MNTIESGFGKDLVYQIKGLPAVDTSATEFKDLSSDQIAKIIFEKYHGQIQIDLQKASKPEREAILAAANVKIDGQSPKIIEVNAGELEDQALNGILAEVLDSETLQSKFVLFLQKMAENPQLLKTEWDKYFASHQEDAEITSILDGHYMSNLGLKKGKDGESQLRDKTATFLESAIDEIRAQVDELLASSSDFFKKHPNPDFNNLETYLAVLGWAMLSNFVRGAIFYSIRLGEDSEKVHGYEPRRIASETLKE